MFLLFSFFIHDCVGTSLDTSPWVAVLDGIVILISFVSMVQCLRSLINSWLFAVSVRKFFFMKFDSFRLKWNSLLPLFNFWHVGVIISDALVIVGSILKLLISYNVSPLSHTQPPAHTHTRAHTHTHTHTTFILSLPSGAIHDSRRVK